MANRNTNGGNITRSGSIDQLRASITVVVVGFHAALGYVTFLVSTYQDTSGSIPVAPVVDEVRWAGFDLFFAFNDTFFMALMFFISGLFVVPSLERKGVTFFCKDRAWRLGAPFLLGVLFLSPVAYYPHSILTGSDLGYFAFWRDMILIGPWSPGPLWFIWMLLAFNLLVPPVCRVIQWLGFGGLNNGGLERGVRRDPFFFFLVMIILSIVSYMPVFGLFGPLYWVTSGPIANFQVSRVFLYSRILASELISEPMEPHLPFWVMVEEAPAISSPRSMSPPTA
ncbi:MAG: acyltransferase family protein, partial [Gemmataceae bacterium]